MNLWTASGKCWPFSSRHSWFVVSVCICAKLIQIYFAYAQDFVSCTNLCPRTVDFFCHNPEILVQILAVLSYAIFFPFSVWLQAMCLSSRDHFVKFLCMCPAKEMWRNNVTSSSRWLRAYTEWSCCPCLVHEISMSVQVHLVVLSISGANSFWVHPSRPSWRV